MTVKEILENFKEIQTNILNFIEKESDTEENYQNLEHKIDEQKICDNAYSFSLLLYLIANIANNHFHETDFYPKIERILLFLKDEIKRKYQDFEIFNIFEKNKKILLFLLEEKFLTINKDIATKMQNGKYKKEKYPQYFYPEIRPYIKIKKEKKDTPEQDMQNIKNTLGLNDGFMAFMLFQALGKNRDQEMAKKNSEDSWISEFSNRLPNNFYENRKTGENENYICELIRKDLIDNFISYVQRENYQLNSTIPPSNYETNPFLLKNTKTTLIEYAAFHGSNQIFKYLSKNGVKLTPSIWEYAVHSNNPETIHLIEDGSVKPNSYLKILRESIKCHHNEVADYIINNYLDEKSQPKSDDTLSSTLKSYNFAFLEENSINHKSFFDLCRYDYYIFVEQLINQKDVDVNEIHKKNIDIGYHEKFTEKKTILHICIEKGNIKMVKLLLTNENLDVNIKKNSIIESPHPEREVNLMMDMIKGKEWDPWDEWSTDNDNIYAKITPLYLAIDNENIEIIKLLLQSKNLDINSLSEFSMPNPEENHKLMTPLHRAVEKENIEIIRLLLENKSIDPNVICVELSNDPDGNGKHIQRRERTALVIAVENENVEIVKLLTSSEKVDPNISRVHFSYRDEHEEWNSSIDDKERPPLQLAIYKKNIEIFRLLLNCKNIDLNCPQIEIKSEIWINDAEEWDDRRAEYQDPTVETSYRWDDIPDELISTLRETKTEKTPLYFAIESGNERAAELLLGKKEIDVNAKSKLIHKNIKENGKNINTVEEKTALDLATSKGNYQIVQLIKSHKK